MKMRNIIIAAIIFAFTSIPVIAAVEIDDINHSKPPAYRLGTGDGIENKEEIIKLIDTENVKEAKQKVGVEALTYADLSLKRISQELSQNLEMNYEDMIGDLGVL